MVSTPFRLILAQNTNIFIFLHQKQVKSVEITPNKQETPQDWVRLSGFIWIGLVVFNPIKYLLSTKQEQHLRQLYNLITSK